MQLLPIGITMFGIAAVILGASCSAQKKEIATIETSLGTIEVELYASDAPKTFENFKGLAAKGFFDGLLVHRVSKGFVIQTGDDKTRDSALVNDWGTGGQTIWGKPFDNELNEKTRSYQEGYKKGVVAMANKGIPGTNTSQFFILLDDAPFLPKEYTIFGIVRKGMEVAEKIGNVEIIPLMGPTDGRPKEKVVIQKVTVALRDM